MDSINSKVGSRIRKVRLMLGLTLEEMSEALCISPGHLRKLERGQNGINLQYLRVLREKYGVDLNYLLTGKAMQEDIAELLCCSSRNEQLYFWHMLLDSYEEKLKQMNISEG